MTEVYVAWAWVSRVAYVCATILRKLASLRFLQINARQGKHRSAEDSILLEYVTALQLYVLHHVGRGLQEVSIKL